MKTRTKEEKTYLILFFICTAVALFMRLFKLGSLPFGVYIDEAGSAYDAYSIANYAVDRYALIRPVYFINFGRHGQSAMNTYSIALMLKLFGGEHINIWLVRLPMVIYSMLAYFAGTYLMKELFGKKYALFGAFFYAILPYYIMQCRFALDCNMLLNFVTMSFWAFYIAYKKDKLWLYIFAGLVIGATYYTYIVSYIPNTITWVLLFFYVLWTSRDKAKKILPKLLVMYFIIFITALPLAVMILINQLGLETLSFHFFTIPRIINYSKDAFTFSINNIWGIIKSSMYMDWLNYDNVPFFGNMYIVSIPFLCIGIIASFRDAFRIVRRREFSMLPAIVVMYLLYFVLAIFMSEIPTTYRINGMYFSQLVMLVYGVRAVCEFVARKNTKYVKFFEKGIVVVYSVLFIAFAGYYFFQYPIDHNPVYYFSPDYSEILEYLEEHNQSEKLTYIDADAIYFAYSNCENPYDYAHNYEGDDEYKNYKFFVHLPTSGLDMGAVFIVSEHNQGAIEQLTPWFDHIYHSNGYVCFFNENIG